MVAKLKKKPFKARIDTGETLVTKANMDDPKVKAVLSPDLSEWIR
jgi:hypothetical protein